MELSKGLAALVASYAYRYSIRPTKARSSAEPIRSCGPCNEAPLTIAILEFSPRSHRWPARVALEIVYATDDLQFGFQLQPTKVD